jgi:hypothetical protein
LVQGREKGKVLVEVWESGMASVLELASAMSPVRELEVVMARALESLVLAPGQVPVLAGRRLRKARCQR